MNQRSAKIKATISRWPRWRLALMAGLLAGALAWVIAWRGCSHRSTTPAVFHIVRRGDFTVSIVEGGTLKAVHEVNVRSELEGTSRIISIVPEGTTAKKGELLVELDSADLRERLNNQEVVCQSADFNYVQGKENLAIQKSLNDSNVKDAELRVEFAKSDLDKYQEGDWPQAKKATQSKITIAQEELKRAQERLNWTVQLEKKGYATKSESEADQLTLQRMQIQLGAAEEELRLLEKYDYPKKVRQMQANVEQADKELERLTARSASQIAQFEADLKTRFNTLELQKTRLEQVKEQLKLTKIYAPQDGLVIFASSSNPNSGILIEEGATVRQRQDLIKLPDVSQMMVEIRVHESHVQKIKPGQSAFVSIDSLPDEQFKGTVRRVAVLPDSSSRYYNPNLKVYATEIVIEDEIPELKPGVSGRAEVIITNLHNVLTVPIQAVTTVKGRQVCFVGPEKKSVPVTVGMYNERWIEIKSGLREGDEVALSSAAAGDNIDLTGSLIDSESATNRPRKEESVPASEVVATNTVKPRVDPPVSVPTNTLGTSNLFHADEPSSRK